MRARSNTLGVPHHISNFDSLPVAEVAHAAVGGYRATRQVPDFCVLFGLIEPARSRLSYCFTERVVSDPAQLFTNGRDFKCLHGQMGSGRAGAQGAILHRREWNG